MCLCVVFMCVRGSSATVRCLEMRLLFLFFLESNNKMRFGGGLVELATMDRLGMVTVDNLLGWCREERRRNGTADELLLGDILGRSGRTCDRWIHRQLLGRGDLLLLGLLSAGAGDESGMDVRLVAHRHQVGVDNGHVHLAKAVHGDAIYEINCVSSTLGIELTPVRFAW